MAFLSLSDCLTHADDFARLSVRLKQLQELQATLHMCLPENLASLCRLVNLRVQKDGFTAVIHATNGHTVAALRQLTPRILAALAKKQPSITRLHIKLPHAQ